jgi:glycogen synthase
MILKAKEREGAGLAKKFHLDLSKRPWLGAITRLVPQKGPELLEEALRKTVALGGTFALLGSSPIPTVQRHFETLKERYKGHPQVLLYLDYDEALAHKLYSALDFLIVPSHFEPCGLTQLIAMHYGTIPIVRATGGLKDTVFDGQNGFVFEKPSKEAVCQVLERAFRLWHTEPSSIQTMINRGMRSDVGWERPAEEYRQLYTEKISPKPF